MIFIHNTLNQASYDILKNSLSLSLSSVAKSITEKKQNEKQQATNYESYPL